MTMMSHTVSGWVGGWFRIGRFGFGFGFGYTNVFLPPALRGTSTRMNLTRQLKDMICTRFIVTSHRIISKLCQY